MYTDAGVPLGRNTISEGAWSEPAPAADRSCAGRSSGPCVGLIRGAGSPPGVLQTPRRVPDPSLLPTYITQEMAHSKYLMDVYSKMYIVLDRHHANDKEY